MLHYGHQLCNSIQPNSPFDSPSWDPWFPPLYKYPKGHNLWVINYSHVQTHLNSWTILDHLPLVLILSISSYLRLYVSLFQLRALTWLLGSTQTTVVLSLPCLQPPLHLKLLVTVTSSFVPQISLISLCIHTGPSYDLYTNLTVRVPLVGTPSPVSRTSQSPSDSLSYRLNRLPVALTYHKKFNCRNHPLQQANPVQRSTYSMGQPIIQVELLYRSGHFTIRVTL